MSDELAAILRVGQQALIHFGGRESDAPRYSTIFRGWVNRAYIMADTPMADGKPIPIVLGAPCVVRFLADGTACGFSANIVHAKRNEIIFRIGWPNDVEYVVVRKHERVRTAIRCSVGGTAHGVQTAELVDLSVGGCRVNLTVPVEQGASIVLSMETAPGKTLGPLKAIVRSTLVRGAGYSLGCQFESVNETVRLELENLVAMRMQSLRADAGTLPCTLVVATDAALVDAVKRTLTGLNWEVIVTSSVIDAFHCLRSSHVHALLAECGLTDLSGAEICRVVRATKEFENLPVILCNGVPNDEAAARAVGANHFFVSGTPAEQLAEAVRIHAASPAS